MLLDSFSCTKNMFEELILKSHANNTWGWVHQNKDSLARGKEFVDEVLLSVVAVGESSSRGVNEPSAKFRALEFRRQEESCTKESY